MEDSNLDFRYVMLHDLDISREKMVALFASSGDPDQTPHSVVPDLGLHYLPITLFRFSGSLDCNGLKQQLQQTTFSNFFFYFQRKQSLTFRVNCLLGRCLIWNIKTYFLWKIMKKYTECHLLQILLRAIR